MQHILVSTISGRAYKSDHRILEIGQTLLDVDLGLLGEAAARATYVITRDEKFDDVMVELTALEINDSPVSIERIPRSERSFLETRIESDLVKKGGF